MFFKFIEYTPFNIQKNNLLFTLKKKKKFALLRSPHVFSKFKQTYLEFYFINFLNFKFKNYKFLIIYNFINLCKNQPKKIKIKKKLF